MLLADARLRSRTESCILPVACESVITLAIAVSFYAGKDRISTAFICSLAIIPFPEATCLRRFSPKGKATFYKHYFCAKKFLYHIWQK
jgi:hypothetical protein